MLPLRLLVAAASGALVAASFQPAGWWPAALVGMALLFAALKPWRRRLGVAGAPDERYPYPKASSGALIGFVHAAAQYLILLPWIASFVGAMPYLALVVALSLYALLTGALGVLVARWRLGFLAFPFLYVAVEYARSHFPWGGFAWVRLAWGQVGGPLEALTRWGGPALVSLAAALVGCALAALVGLRGRRVAGLVVIFAVTLAALLAGSRVGSGEVTGTARVAAVQGNVPRTGLDETRQALTVLNNHAEVTERIDEDVDLVIWPENSSDVDAVDNPKARTRVARAARAVDAPVLVGTRTTDEVGERNTMAVIETSGRVGDVHHKKYLQPFGETMPLRDTLRHVTDLVDYAGDFKPGNGNGVVEMAGVRLGVATCYEVAFDSAYRDAVDAGAELLATPTNNATFGETDMTYQQMAMSRLRAIEHDRAVVVAATTGSSAIINPDGTVEEKTELWRPATLIYELPLKETGTPATWASFWLELGAVIMGCAIAAAALLGAAPAGLNRRAATVRPAA